MSHTVWWSLDSKPVTTPDEVQAVIEEATQRVYPHGGRGITLRVGDGDELDAPLRLDIDTDADRAAVSWQGTTGAEPDVPEVDAITVGDSPYDPPQTIPATQARVTPAAAIRAAREYVTTGTRPTCLQWLETV